MTNDDVIRWAQDSGFGKLLTGDGLPDMWHGYSLDALERFAALAYAAGAEAERAECAKVADDSGRWIGDWIAKYGDITVASAIRARGNGGE